MAVLLLFDNPYVIYWAGININHIQDIKSKTFNFLYVFLEA